MSVISLSGIHRPSTQAWLILRLPLLLVPVALAAHAGGIAFWEGVKESQFLFFYFLLFLVCILVLPGLGITTTTTKKNK